MIKQLCIIMCVLGVAHIFVSLTGLRMPASIVGMLLLAVMLKRRWIAGDSVKDACRTIINNLGFFFIPPGVALMVKYDVIMAEWPAIVVTTVCSTVMVMVVTAFAHRLMKGGKA